MPSAASLAALRTRIRQIERPVRHGVLPFAVAAIDDALLEGGLALGALHEILGAGGDEEDGSAAAGFIAGILAHLGSGAGSFQTEASFPRKRATCPSAALDPRFRGGDEHGFDPLQSGANGGNGPVLWCLKRPDLYGPGLRAHGLDPARLMLVRAPRDDELLWAMEEGLRTPGLAAVVGEIGKLPMVAGRRLQLAAERSGVTALLLRRWRNAAEADAERERPSAAATRWRVAALPSLPPQDPLPQWGRGSEKSGGGGARPGIGRPRWRVELLRSRSGRPGSWDVEVADATGHVSLSAGLADRPPAPQWGRGEALQRRAG